MIPARALDPASPLAPWTHGPRAWAGGALLLTALVGAVAAPLFTYAATLALLGPAHVAAELRYVERRFGWLLLGSFGAGLAVLLAGVAGVRAARVGGLLSGEPGIAVELGVVALLAAVVALRGGRPAALALVTGALVGAGALYAPTLTLLALACLHNWTPVGFLWEATAEHGRRHAKLLVAGLFVALPLLVATGLPWAAVSALGLGMPDATWLAEGPLRAHYQAYLPREVHGAAWAQHAFSALVFAQCLHYFVVIGVLPTLPGRAAPGAPRLLSALPPRVFAGALVLAGVAVAAAFAADFGAARSWYGVPAAVHAWIEVPVLLAALLGAPPPRA